MPANENLELVDAYLLIEQPRQRLGHWTQALAALDSPSAPALAAITAFYDPVEDQAVLHLRYDELALGSMRLGYVVEVALLAEIGMIQPAALSEFERKRFLSERLARCTFEVTHQRSAIGALTELVRKLKEQRRPPPIPRAARANVAPRGDTQDPVMLVSAKGTRDNLDTAAVAATTGKHVIVRSQRLPTVEMAPEDVQRFVTETEIVDVEAPPRVVPAPELPASGTGTIYARYLRSGRWVPIRIGALSLKGAALMAGALPRLHDQVDVALAFGAHRALVRGAVGKVSTVREASATGAATFSVAFDLDVASRRQLVALLTAARAANVTIKPPPPRSNRRFPVEWPMCLGTMRGAVKADALDVSTGGLFVRPTVALARNGTLNFSMIVDDGAGPVAGRAKVVRQLTESEAKANGLSAGYGLAITDMNEPDRLRWTSFLARVERRAATRVLIAAAPARLAELQAYLAAAGYAVTGGTDPGAVVQLANAGTRPVDAALLDAGWLANGASGLENLFAARHVPCVTLHGDLRRARTALDRLLEVCV